MRSLSAQNFAELSPVLGPLSHRIFSAARPWMAAQVESATTATPLASTS